MDMIFILGAPDPEMAEIEAVLTAAGRPYVYAAIGGARVHSGNAYKADGVLPGTHAGLPSDDGYSRIVLVECGLAHVWGQYSPNTDGTLPILVVDHHRPGDPGYGRPPEEYATASSLGQVLALLGQQPTATQRLAMAADHCLGHAYAGHCTGVDPVALLAHRVAMKAAFQCRVEADVLRDIEAARRILRHRAKDGVADLRDAPTIPEIPEAAAVEGVAFLATVPERGTGRRKVVVQGAATPDMLRRFLAGEIAPELVDRYGDPSRGYAGGYLPA